MRTRALAVAIAAAGMLMAMLGTASAQAPEVTRVSVSSTGAQALGESLEPTISDDGRYVAFRTNAANLVMDDTNGAVDVFLHDRVTGVTTRVSISSAGEQANGSSFTPRISGDGR